MEDIMTSNVFGSFRYLDDPNDGLMPFIGLATDLDGNKLKDSIPGVVAADYQFWQDAGFTRSEPDVVITLTHKNGSKSIVLIEAKYRSGKSSEAEEVAEGTMQEAMKVTDQLAREWVDLEEMAQEESAHPFLIYVTADFAFPRKDIENSQNELSKKHGETGNIYWLSWRYLIHALAGMSHPILSDLVDLLDKRYELRYYRGLLFDTTIVCKWNFEVRFDWPSGDILSPWRFEA